MLSLLWCCCFSIAVVEIVVVVAEVAVEVHCFSCLIGVTSLARLPMDRLSVLVRCFKFVAIVEPSLPPSPTRNCC